MSVIPVLTAGFGEGHNAAARSIIEALGRKPGLTGELLGLGDDVPDFVEQLLARDGVDIGTAPLGRLRGAVSYLTTSRGREALAKWRTERDAALDAVVEYETTNTEEG